MPNLYFYFLINVFVYFSLNFIFFIMTVGRCGHLTYRPWCIGMQIKKEKECAESFAPMPSSPLVIYFIFLNGWIFKERGSCQNCWRSELVSVVKFICLAVSHFPTFYLPQCSESHLPTQQSTANWDSNVAGYRACYAMNWPISASFFCAVLDDYAFFRMRDRFVFKNNFYLILNAEFSFSNNVSFKN